MTCPDPDCRFPHDGTLEDPHYERIIDTLLRTIDALRPLCPSASDDAIEDALLPGVVRFYSLGYRAAERAPFARLAKPD